MGRNAGSRVAIVSGLVLAVAACGPADSSSPTGPVQGQGPVSVETRPAGEFQHISAADGIVLVVRSGSPTAVRVSAQENVLPLVRTQITNGQLVVNIDAPGATSIRPITVSVVAPAIHSVALSGGAAGTVEMMSAELKIDVSGGATVTATGRARSLEVTATSGAAALLGELVADSAAVKLSGGSRLELQVVNAVTGTAEGGATLWLTTPPATVDVATSSGATVQGG